MKKSLLLITICITLIVIIIFSFKGKTKDDIELPEYPGNYICVSEGINDLDGDDTYYLSKAYLTVENGYVKSAVYQHITENQSEALTDAIIKLYKDIDGIKISKDKVENVDILTIHHDYMKISLEDINEKLGNILEDDSLFKRYDILPIKYEEYKNSELEGYECYEN